MESFAGLTEAAPRDLHAMDRPSITERTTPVPGIAPLPLAATPAAPTPLVRRHFTRPGVSPLDGVQWTRTDARIDGPGGEPVFEQTDVEVPASWSKTAVNVVVSKYFRGHLGTPGRERSVRQLIGRVVNTITAWGEEQGYLKPGGHESQTFADELTWLLVHQRAAFNSPVWFNVGVEPEPQCSACFILSVKDSMASILDLAKTEGRIFKWGSGAGTNFSTLRGSEEALGGGGTASGPVSFMRGFDAFAGVIKSGGKTRRAAKMVILNVDHPDIEHFIQVKAGEEKKAHALIDAGYDGNFDATGGAYESVSYQNANHSVRLTDRFMQALQGDADWELRAVTDGRSMKTLRARELFRDMAEATWFCGDPGVQYDTTINRWNTCAGSGRIEASNPCSEYMFLNNSACNLASLNLMSFHDEHGRFDTEGFAHAAALLTIAMDIIVERASYPTPEIRENSHLFRPLGLGYANLGALLMARGLPYDSDAGRAYAATLTGLMHGHAMRTSARLAARLGPFARWEENREAYLRVVHQHAQAVDDVDRRLVPAGLFGHLKAVWREVEAVPRSGGSFRNAQLSLLAPTGTIGFMMDCDTTGIEPELSLVRYKTLVGGGVMKLVNGVVPEGLAALGYSREQVARLNDHLAEHGHLETAPDLDPAHQAVFDCAFRARGGKRCIEPMGHVRMMAAVQPFLSGAISKTVNLPNEATVEDIERIYIEGWRLGLKAVAVYRDGCKRTQPLNTDPDAGQAKEGASVPAEAEADTLGVTARRHLPAERASLTHKFSVAGHDGYITVGMFPNGRPGELFVVISKQGSTINGLMDAFATAVSIALQYGVPLEDLIRKFSHVRFEPSGFTGNQEIPFAKSIIDYIFRWMALRFGINDGDLAQTELPLLPPGGPSPPPLSSEARPRSEAAGVLDAIDSQADAPACPECGFITVRNGSCYKCLNCGSSLGCS